MKPITLLITDDHELIRAGLRSLLEGMDGFEVVAEAATGREAVRLTEKYRPQVVLMDIMMPELDGLDATRQLAQLVPESRVLILSMNANEQYVLRAMQAGAAGYMLKNVSPVELQLALRAVSRGEKYLCPGVAHYVIAGYVGQAAGSPTSSLDRLTLRQREVLKLIAEGHTTKEIAGQLCLSVKAVEAHRTRLKQELDIRDVAGLVRYAIGAGLVEAGG